MSRLDLYYLGSPHVELNNRTVELRLAKSGALLAYLAVTGKPHSRGALATLLWPESDSDHGLTSLRSILLEINQTLGRDWLIADRKTVYLNPEADFWLDVHNFNTRIAACRAHGHSENDVCARCLPLLTTAVNLYHGDFMAGFSLRDSVNFDEWQLFQSEYFRKLQINALTRLTQFFSAQGLVGMESAIAFARRNVEFDPLNEATHRQLMLLYIQNGQRNEARRQYQLCEHILSKELGVAPSEATRALLHQDGGEQRIPATDPLPVARLCASPDVAPAAGIAHPLPDTGAVQHPPGVPKPAGLPARLTPFLGREAERAAIAFLLCSTPTCRLVTLVGPGGIGKTRLALQVAEELASGCSHGTVFPHGVAFVGLDSVDFPEYLVPTILESLPFAPRHEEPTLDALLTYLRDKSLLLLLDSFDNLLGHTDMLVSILQTAPQVKLLVTSQEPLYLQGEWLVKVTGIEYPSENAKHVQDYHAVQLFLQAARRVSPDFAPAVEDWPWIGRICRLVDGMPLGIELAATWTRMLSCREIALRIEDNLEFLSTSLRNVPPRHRSLRAVFEHTWSLLSPEERRVFQQISVFVGGFCEEAATQVVRAPLTVLLSLVDRGLLHRQASGRYNRHPLLWGYAAEKLAADPLSQNIVRDRHSAYYTAFLKEKLSQLGYNPTATLAIIEADIENIRAALQWSIRHPQSTEADQTLEQLYYAYEKREWVRGRQ
ncbi:MAG: NACHT domain-containing protein [Anaerolineae bacterium]|nr:NACHT domain-containing protein [Anaerolineae bacterium]